jgi:hypothetical protein
MSKKGVKVRKRGLIRKLTPDIGTLSSSYNDEDFFSRENKPVLAHHR